MIQIESWHHSNKFSEIISQLLSCDAVIVIQYK